MPAVVDLCAVAGMVDILRTQGCFGLSARYAIALGLSTSTIKDDLVGVFPPYQYFEEIGNVFEHGLGEMHKAAQPAGDTRGNPNFLVRVENDPVLRHSFALRVASKLEARTDSLLTPLKDLYYLEIAGKDMNGGTEISNAEQAEKRATILDFCIATIHAFFDNDLFFTTRNMPKDPLV
jgi:hypothetical protein